MMQLKPVVPAEIESFRCMVEAYWHDVMPSADVVRNEQQRDTYFHQSFAWQEGDQPPLWAIVDGQTIGFVHYTIDPKTKRATIEDFYVAPYQRRRGYGTLMVQALYMQFDALGVELVELNVRRDNPQARAFWEAQGFRIALYRMRQYRDLTTGNPSLVHCHLILKRLSPPRRRTLPWRAVQQITARDRCYVAKNGATSV